MGSALQSNMGPIFRATQQQSGCDKRPARSGRLPHASWPSLSMASMLLDWRRFLHETSHKVLKCTYVLPERYAVDACVLVEWTQLPFIPACASKSLGGSRQAL